MVEVRKVAEPAVAVRRILGLSMHAVTMAEACEICERAVDHGEHMRIGCANAAKVVKMRHDERLRHAVASSDLLIADGSSLVWASKLLGQRLPERVAGIDLFFQLLALANRRGFSVYFLGATQEVMATLIDKVRADYPNLVIAGFRDGYFSSDESEAVAAEVARTSPDFLFLGMGTPKKELFLANWAGQTQAIVSHGVGGSFDVYAGKVNRAPKWMRQMGLEWFYRVLQEPGRMWKRYLVTNIAFAALLLKALCGRLGQRKKIAPE